MAVTILAQSLGTKYVLDVAALGRVREVLTAGGLVVHPTDTVYGLAADPFQGAAIDRLFAAKGRPRGTPVSIAVAEVSDIFRFGERSPIAEAFVAKNLPGPFTIILRATASAPQPVVGSDGRIGLRVPNHAIPRLLAKSFGPITSTSANVHGKPSPTTCDEARINSVQFLVPTSTVTAVSAIHPSECAPRSSLTTFPRRNRSASSCVGV